MPHDEEPAAGRLPDVTEWARGQADVVASPALRARLAGARVEPRLRPWQLGAWTGRPLAEVPAEHVARWRRDPRWAGHGGESLHQVHERVAALLEEWRSGPPRRVAVTHGSVVRCAVLLALRAPVEAAWDLDVRPGSRTELAASPQGWRVQSVGCP